jgi:N-acetylmuramoyl-L-alanine amidase
MARRIARRIAHALGMRVRGDGGWIEQTQTKRGRLGFVRAGGLVVEVFFLSNPKDLETYRSRVWLVAEAIAIALTEADGRDV